MSKTVPQNQKTRDLPGLMVRADFVPGSVNEEERTVRVQYTTGAAVKRGKWVGWDWEEYLEELSTTPGHVRLDRLKNGAAPVLNSHRNSDLSDVMGTVIEADETHATLKFSERAEVESYWKDIVSGILRNVSVGYRVHRYQDVTPDGDKIKVLRAIDWEPYEISMVPIPADAGAGVRSEQANSCVVIGRNAETSDKGQENMSKTTETRASDTQVPQPAPAPAAAPAIDERALDEARREAVEAERTRTSEIQNLVRSVGLEDTVATELVSGGKSIDEARKIVLERLAVASEAEAPIKAHATVRMNGQSSEEKRSEAIGAAIMHRAAPSQFALEGQAREFRGMTLLDLARESIGYQESRGLSKMEIAARAMHSTSDFPLILANVANKSLRKGYADTRRSFQPFSRQVTLPDFKNVQRLALSNAPSLKQVVEGAEYEQGSFSENGESYRLFTYGRIFAITREAIINDDLDAFTRVPMKMAAAAARLENRMVYDILLGNPVMSDGVALFNAAHNNLVNNDLGVNGIGALRTKLRTQKDPSGEDVMNYDGKYLIVPAALETEAAKLKALIAPAKTDDVNPYANSFEIISEGYLDSVDPTSYYMAIDPSQGDTIEYAYLEGETGPYIESREGFTRDGLEIKVRHDFAAKAIDFRGLAKSTNNE